MNAVGLLFDISWQHKQMLISEMTTGVLAWLYDMFTNADANPSEQLRGRGFFKMCSCIHVAMVVADPIGL